MAIVEDQTSPARRAPEGIQVAGIFDLLRLAELLGQNVDDLADAARAGDPGAWADNRAFIGLRGRPAVEVPDAFYGGPLQQFGSIDEMMQSGPTLQEYLSSAGAPASDMLGDALADYRVGMAPSPGFEAGATPPQYVDLPDGTRRLLQQGFVVVDDRIPNTPEALRPLLAHEGTHVAQSVLDTPSGSNMADANLIAQYFDATGAGPVPQYRQELRSMLPGNRIGQLPRLAYIHSFGEAEARAAQRRAGNEGLLTMMPTREDYAWNPYGLPFRSDLVYENTPQTLEDAKDWWRSGGNGGQ
jgi:hypothetical protein